MFEPNGHKISELEMLDPNYWSQTLDNSSIDSYQPRDPITKKKMRLNLDKLYKSLMKGKPDFAFYLGSENTPPCEGKI